MAEEEKEDDKTDILEKLGFGEKLLKSRTIVISEVVNSKLAARVLQQIIMLEQDDPEKGITIYINCPGGEVFSGFAIFDMLAFVDCEVTTIVTGFAASMGSILSLAASPGKRYIMPNAKIMIHQPLLTGYQGKVSDMEIQAREILTLRDRLIDIYCKSTGGKSYDEIKKAIDQDNWFSAQEAIDYNLIDKIITKRSDLPLN